MEKGYPEPDAFGVLPSWGLFVRHASNLQVRGLALASSAPDARPAVVLDDVAGARFFAIQLSVAEGRPSWSLVNVSGLHALDATRLPDGDLGVLSGPTLY